MEPLLFADENASSEAKEWVFISVAEKRKDVKELVVFDIKNKNKLTIPIILYLQIILF